MSEGPEVRRTADRLTEALGGEPVVAMELRARGGAPAELIEAVVGSHVTDVETFGKHLVMVFSSGIYLYNHMMMWGKWRTYPRERYEAGLAKPPPRYGRPGPRTGPTVEDVRKDSRVRLVLTVPETVAVEFNGPLLRFSRTHPKEEGAIALLGPDALRPRFRRAEARRRLEERLDRSLADLLLDQRFVAGVGNKYKSEILFLLGLYPFLTAEALSRPQRDALIAAIPRVLRHGYRTAGTTRAEEGPEGTRWDRKHWVFRRGGRPCFVCGTPIVTDRSRSARVTFFCSVCQPEGGPGSRVLSPLPPAGG